MLHIILLAIIQRSTKLILPECLQLFQVAARTELHDPNEITIKHLQSTASRHSPLNLGISLAEDVASTGDHAS